MAKIMTSGGEALIRALADENVDIIFGYPGGAALHIYDAIYQQAVSYTHLTLPTRYRV